MLSINKSIRSFSQALACALLAISPVWADDTEIFFGDFSDGEISPNVLFVVDTSGSMGNTVSGTGMTRMQNVQAALTTLLTNLNDVNVGLMRFSNPGGPVLFQVDYIDRDLNETEGELIDVSYSISDDDDDAQEVVSSGEMVLDDQRLKMVTLTVGTFGTAFDDIDDYRDDAEEEVDKGGQNVTRNSSDLDITHDSASSGDEHLVGLRFTGMNIPQGATVTNAYVTFYVDDSSSGELQAKIWGEPRDSGRFDYEDNDNISERSDTTAEVDWFLPSTAVGAGSQAVNTPDISTIIQEIIDYESGGSPVWNGPDGDEDDIVLFFGYNPQTPAVENEWDFKSYDHSGGQEPELTVEYYVGSPPGDYPAHTGLRFQNVIVPKGATITNAYIDFTVGQADSGEATALTIYGEDNDEPAIFTSTNGDISGRTKTSANLNWEPPTWDTVGETKTTPNLATIVQEIVNRADWCGGDDMAFIIEGTAGGLRMAWSRDASNGYQPNLRIQYEEDSVIAGSTCTLTTVSKRIVSSLDDVEENGSSVSTTSDELNMQGSNAVGLRFTQLNIPQGANILEATLEFDPYYDNSGTGTYKIEIENADDAAVFTSSDGTIDDRTWHGTSVSWTESTFWNAGGRYKSDDIKTLIQNVVDRSGWTLGSDMAFRLTKTSGVDRRFESYDEDPVSAVLLTVKFEDDGSATDVRLVRDELLAQIASLNTSGYTPIQDTLYEAALYYKGLEVDYGKARGSGPYAYTRVSAAQSMESGTYTINRPGGCTEEDLGASACAGETITGSGGSQPTYKTPIDDWCQTNNHIILLTDGEANQPHSDSKIATLIEDSCDNTGLSNTGQYCVKDLVRYLNEKDQSDLKEAQRVTTHTIGFNFSSTWLADVAAAGGGQYREATQAADLVEEIEQILTAVLKTNSSFVAPVAAINQFNRLNHRNEIYFALFRPDETPGWPGNLKKYRLRESDNAVVDDSDPPILAVNPDTGFFTDNAKSYWSSSVDGKEVDQGGAEENLPAYSARKIYTYYNGSTSKDLSNSVNLVSTSNDKLTADMLGVDADQRANLINWIRGQYVDDVDNDTITAESRYVYGDPLHSKPIAVTYGGTEADPDITVFFGTNAGMLHAVNASTGAEQFAFIPEDLYDEQSVLREANINQSHVYGIDGSVTPWVYDKNGDGVITAGEGDFVYIYVGQRRGGRNYYALNVTDRNNPKMLWEIKGGTGSFGDLGQSWGKPVLGTIDIDGTKKNVIYLSGGYDDDQDDTYTRKEDNVGNVIYIVDATTGDLIWSGGKTGSYTETFPDMKYSFPATLSVADVGNDGTDDVIFVGDMGGQLWRFDIHNTKALDDLITGGVVADLGVAALWNTKANNRRFYHAPDIALVTTDDAKSFAVTIGSGFRAHPLDTGTTDRFYMMMLPRAYNAGTSYTKYTETHFYDATANEIGADTITVDSALNGKQGWYFNLPNAGEKILSTPLTFKGTVTFTTYEPNPNSVTSNCIPAAGVSRIYQVNLEDGTPVNEWDGDISALSPADRSYKLQTSSIIDEPVIVCTGDNCDLFVGAEKPPIETTFSDRVVKSFWRQEQ